MEQYIPLKYKKKKRDFSLKNKKVIHGPEKFKKELKKDLHLYYKK